MSRLGRPPRRAPTSWGAEPQGSPGPRVPLRVRSCSWSEAPVRSRALDRAPWLAGACAASVCLSWSGTARAEEGMRFEGLVDEGLHALVLRSRARAVEHRVHVGAQLGAGGFAGPWAEGYRPIHAGLELGVGLHEAPNRTLAIASDTKLYYGVNQAQWADTRPLDLSGRHRLRGVWGWPGVTRSSRAGNPFVDLELEGRFEHASRFDTTFLRKELGVDAFRDGHLTGKIVPMVGVGKGAALGLSLSSTMGQLGWESRDHGFAEGTQTRLGARAALSFVPREREISRGSIDLGAVTVERTWITPPPASPRAPALGGRAVDRLEVRGFDAHLYGMVDRSVRLWLSASGGGALLNDRAASRERFMLVGHLGAQIAGDLGRGDELKLGLFGGRTAFAMPDGSALAAKVRTEAVVEVTAGEGRFGIAGKSVVEHLEIDAGKKPQDLGLSMGSSTDLWVRLAGRGGRKRQNDPLLLLGARGSVSNRCFGSVTPMSFEALCMEAGGYLRALLDVTNAGRERTSPP